MCGNYRQDFYETIHLIHPVEISNHSKHENMNEKIFIRFKRISFYWKDFFFTIFRVVAFWKRHFFFGKIFSKWFSNTVLLAHLSIFFYFRKHVHPSQKCIRFSIYLFNRNLTLDGDKMNNLFQNFANIVEHYFKHWLLELF